MDPSILSLLTQLPMVAVMFFLYMGERSENKKLVEQLRSDMARHEETILRLASSLGHCPMLGKLDNE